MRFIDFTQKQLVGKPIVWTIGGQGNGIVKTITKIKSCLSSGFTIEGDQDNRVFNYYNGHQRALTGKTNHSISQCVLVSETEIESIRLKWIDDTVKKDLIQSIKDNLSNLSQLTIEQLVMIEDIVNKK